MAEPTGVMVYVLDADLPGEEGEHFTFPAVPRVGETFVDARQFPELVRVFTVEQVRHVLSPFDDPEQVEVQIIVRLEPTPKDPPPYLRRLGPSAN